MHIKPPPPPPSPVQTQQPPGVGTHHQYQEAHHHTQCHIGSSSKPDMVYLPTAFHWPALINIAISSLASSRATIIITIINSSSGHRASAHYQGPERRHTASGLFTLSFFRQLQQQLPPPYNRVLLVTVVIFISSGGNFIISISGHHQWSRPLLSL